MSREFKEPQIPKESVQGAFYYACVFAYPFWGGCYPDSIEDCLRRLANWRAVVWYIIDGSNPNEPIFYVSCDVAREYIETNLSRKDSQFVYSISSYGLNPDNANIILAYRN